MLYRRNETMELLGKQYYMKILGKEPEHTAFNEMMNAYQEDGNIHYADIAMDAFMLGYIYGKRAEREKKK